MLASSSGVSKTSPSRVVILRENDGLVGDVQRNVPDQLIDASVRPKIQTKIEQ